MLYKFKKINMLLKSKIMMVILLFTLVSIYSVGFSSWIIGDSSIFSNQVNVYFGVGNVILNSDFVQINMSKGNDNSGVDYFKYNNQYGFLNNSSFGNVASIKFYITFNYANYKEINAYNNAINMIFELKYENYLSDYLLIDSYNDNSSVNVCAAISNSFTYFDSQLVQLNTNTMVTNEHSIVTTSTLNFNDLNPNSLRYINLEIDFEIEVIDTNVRNNIFQNEFPTAKYILKVS